MLEYNGRLVGTKGYQARWTTVVKDRSKLTVKCTFQSRFDPTINLPPAIQKTYEIAFGPDSVSFTSPTKKSQNVCNSKINNIGVIFICGAGDTNPQPEYSFNNGNFKTAKITNIDFSGGGRKKIFCAVRNPIFPDDLKQVTVKEYTVRVPPSRSPRLVITGDVIDDDVSTILDDKLARVVRENVDVSVGCQINGTGYPSITMLTLDCENLGISNRGGLTIRGYNSVSLTKSFTRQNGQITCQCSAQHESGCDIPTSFIRVKAAYGPDTVIIQRIDTKGSTSIDTPSGTSSDKSSVYKICPDNKNDVTMRCFVPNGQVFPHAKLTMTLTNQGQDIKVCSNSTDNQCVYTFRPTQGVVTIITCTGENSVLTGLTTNVSDRHVLIVQAPSVEAPELRLNYQTYKGLNQSMKEALISGHDYVITCDVTGGYPAVYDVDIECGGQPVTTGQFQATMDKLGTKCRCRAKHVSGCYHKITEITVLVVKDTTQTDDVTKSSNTSSNTGLIAGATVGGLVFMSALVVAAYCIGRRNARMSKPTTKSGSTFQKGGRADSIIYSNTFDLDNDVTGGENIRTFVNDVQNTNQEHGQFSTHIYEEIGESDLAPPTAHIGFSSFAQTSTSDPQDSDVAPPSGVDIWFSSIAQTLPPDPRFIGQPVGSSDYSYMEVIHQHDYVNGSSDNQHTYMNTASTNEKMFDNEV